MSIWFWVALVGAAIVGHFLAKALRRYFRRERKKTIWTPEMEADWQEYGDFPPWSAGR